MAAPAPRPSVAAPSMAASGDNTAARREALAESARPAPPAHSNSTGAAGGAADSAADRAAAGAPAAARTAAAPAPAAPSPQALGAARVPSPVTRAARASVAESWLTSSDLSVWRWRSATGEEGALPSDWLASLVAATKGQWTPVDSATAAAATEQVVLLHEGRPRGRLTWVGGGLVACEPVGRCELAALSNATLDALRQALRR